MHSRDSCERRNPCGTIRSEPYPSRRSACPRVASDIGLPGTSPANSRSCGSRPVIVRSSMSSAVACVESGTRCSPGLLRRISMRSPGIRHGGSGPPRSNSGPRALHSSPCVTVVVASIQPTPTGIISGTVEVGILAGQLLGKPELNEDESELPVRRSRCQRSRRHAALAPCCTRKPDSYAPHVRLGNATDPRSAVVAEDRLNGLRQALEIDSPVRQAVRQLPSSRLTRIRNMREALRR